MAAPEAVVNIAEKFDHFSEVYSPKIIAEFNDYHFKVARLLGAFDWHTHDDTDEECHVILIEPSGTPNTGDVATAAKENWV